MTAALLFPRRLRVLQVWPLPRATSGGMSGENSRHRAKVYCLNDDGQWDDRGTGQAFIQYLPVRLLLLATTIARQ